MVKCGMELTQLFVGQLQNLLGLPAGIEAVSGGGIKAAGQMPVQQGGGIGHGALHLIVDHPLENQRRSAVAGIGKLQPMAFLAKVPLPQQRKEHRVQIHLHEVVKILGVLGRERIEGPVAGRQGIHEAAEAAFEHGEKGIPHRETPRSAQHRMLENVRHARGILGWSPEADAEQVLVVRSLHMHPAGAGLLMTQLYEGRIQIREFGNGRYGKTVPPSADPIIPYRHCVSFSLAQPASRLTAPAIQADMNRVKKRQTVWREMSRGLRFTTAAALAQDSCASTFFRRGDATWRNQEQWPCSRLPEGKGRRTPPAGRTGHPTNPGGRPGGSTADAPRPHGRTLGHDR